LPAGLAVGFKSSRPVVRAAGWGAPRFRDLWIRRQDVQRLHTDGINHMTRDKVRTSFISLERVFPHIVEMIVPEGGFGKTQDAMYDFHARHGIGWGSAFHRRNHPLTRAFFDSYLGRRILYCA
jgi:hypothetical protein